MELSNEDLLRLNVLLANPIEAIRIDESSMTVCGLSGATAARVRAGGPPRKTVTGNASSLASAAA